jgi:hypothetical protein
LIALTPSHMAEPFAHPGGSLACWTECAKQGSPHATSGICQGMANHRLSAQSRMAKAQEVSPQPPKSNKRSD